jgi:iron complex outermembrane receptor protein
MSYQTLTRAGTSLVVMGLIMAADAAPAFAQMALEEIIVTTRKREEALQDIPLVITAFSADDLERKGLKGIEDIARLTAGVIVDQGVFPQDVRIVIRGLSPTRGRPNVAVLLDGVDVTSESVQSGGGSLLINPRLFDMERVEVVKGPQSALYGRSAFAGAINYITKKPTNEWESKVALTIGQRAEVEGRVGIYGPLTKDKVFIGLNASVWNFDGFYDNTVTGADLADSDGFGFAFSTIMNLTEDLTFTGRAEYTDDHVGQQPTVFGGTNTLLAVPASAFPPAFPPFNRNGVISPAVPFVTSWTGRVPNASDLPGVTISEDPETGEEFRGSEREILRLAGTFDWDVGFGTLTSITHYASSDGFQRMENTRRGSFNTLTSGTMFSVATDNTLFSQELRIQSDDDQRFRWMFGGLFWDEEVSQDSFSISCLHNQLFPGLPFLPCGPFFGAILASNTPNLWIRNTEHKSAFGMIEFDLTDKFSFHVEGRYTDEELFVSGPSGPRIVDTFGLGGPPNAFPGPTPNIDATDSDSYFTPRFSLEYVPNDDILLYASVAKGAKPGGISTVGAGAAGFDPDLFGFDRETMWVYEVGGKSTWADGRFIINAAAYLEDFSGKQTSSQILRDNGLTGTLTVNASAAEVKGLEVDAAWAPVDGLNLSVGYSYIDAQYNEFVTNATGVGQIAAVGNCTQTIIVTPDPNVPNSRTCAIDRSGNALERTAKHSLVLGAGYSAPVTSDINWLIEADLTSSSKRFESSNNILILPSYTLVDFRLGLTGENWDLIGYANNVFNDDTVQIAFNSVDFSTVNLAFFPPPTTFILTNALQATLPNKRQVGVRMSYSF